MPHALYETLNALLLGGLLWAGQTAGGAGTRFQPSAILPSDSAAAFKAVRQSTPAEPAKVRVPAIAGDYVNVYQPGGDVFPGPNAAELIAGKYYADWIPNDHGFVRDDSGRWHVFGITHPLLANLTKIHAGGTQLFHAIAPPGTLNDVLQEGSWKDLPKVLPLSERPGEIRPIASPCILKRDGLYHLVYGPTPLRYAVSSDLIHWTPKGKMNGAPSGRDPEIFVWNDTYYLIVCGVRDVRVATSRNFSAWTEQPPILELPDGVDPESPFMIQHDGQFYLFVCGWTGKWDHQNLQGAYQHKTYVYVSDNPLKFENQVAVLDAHAPEILQDESGDWFISSVEWPHRGVSLAPLIWQ